MNVQPKLPRPNRSNGVHSQLEGLGLKTYNSSGGALNRAIFNFEPVVRLYKLKIPRLFGILVRDEGILDRKDPKLFDAELEELLLEFGPLIWPEPGKASREHLRTAQAGTLYEADLVYPRDTELLKDKLRGLILSKRVKGHTDIQALIEERHHDARSKVLGTNSKSLPNTPAKRASASRAHSSHKVRRRHGQRYGKSDSDTEDSVMGTTTQRHAFQEPSSSYSCVQLRLYSRSRKIIPGSHGPVVAYGSMFVTPDCTTARACFARVCEKTGADCGFMIFKFPEDMDGTVGGVRLDRGDGEAERTFRRVLEIFRSAKMFPGEPAYRSVEVEVGVDKVGFDEL